MSDLAAAPLWQYRYRLTRADVAAFEALRSDGLAPLLMAIGVIGAVLGWNFALVETHLPFEPGGLVQRTLLGLGIAGLGYAVARAIDWLRRQCRIARHQVPAVDTIVDVFGDHIAWTCDGHADLRPWERVGDVIATPGHVFIFVEPGSALIMPLRAFEGSADMAAFADWAATNIENVLEMLSAENGARG